MTDTIVVARDMIRQLGDFVKTCDPEVPLMVHRTMERVQDAYEEKEIDFHVLIDERMNIEKQAKIFHSNCTCHIKK